MEWNMPINNILRDEITKLDHVLLPVGICADAQSLRNIQEYLSSIVDHLGEMSATAQGLSRVITTGQKMRNNPNASLYLLKDAAGNNGKGTVIGMLKVGHKHLYLSDHAGRVYEVEPLCILDFYVQTNRQRHGLGKKLFDYMLQDTNAQPRHLSVDGPSPVMLQFLEKSYGMKNMVRHPNNFAVVSTFFEEINQISTSGCSTPASVASGVGRFTAPKPHSGIGKIIHGGGQSSDVMSGWTIEAHGDVQHTLPSPMETDAGEGSPPSVLPPVAQRPSTLNVETDTAPQLEPAAPAPSAPPVEEDAAASPAGSRRDSQLTNRGFFDVKFYHNKLW